MAIAKELGVTVNTVQNYEAGRSEPDISLALAISDFYYQIPLDFFAARGIYAHWDWLLAHKEWVSGCVSSQYAGVSDREFLRFVVPQIEDIRFEEVEGRRQVRLYVKPHTEVFDMFTYEERA